MHTKCLGTIDSAYYTFFFCWSLVCKVKGDGTSATAFVAFLKHLATILMNAGALALCSCSIYVLFLGLK